MGVEVRRHLERDPEKDSLLPTTSQNASPEAGDEQDRAGGAEEDDKYTKKRRGPAPAFKCVIGTTPAFALVLFLFIFYVGSRDSTRSGSAFPWPSPKVPEPPFIKEGIEQCKIVQRQAGGKVWDKERKQNDR